MRIVYEYSHLGGSEILQVRYPEINADIHEVINGISASKTKISKEKNRIGELVYNPTELNEAFKESFNSKGYEELKDSFRIPVCSRTSKRETSYSFKQIDFHKDRVLIEVQFGKYFAMFYDMAKFQYFFNENKTDVGIEIVPCNYMKKEMSSGVSYGEHLIYDIKRLKRHFPAVPIKLTLIGPDEDEI